ncbi:ETC complex I subunit [Amorphus sp. 3PC139-8]|uniref:ETC complex I subunit n=1 Tax=Amorphus sp. 3PC139-8 TaxID=2735676 RepID=UPI00345D67D6
MSARIYKPAKTAMQSGRAKTHRWVLEFDPQEPRTIDPLMGWTSSGDMTSQVHLRFPTKEAAILYAEKHGIEFRVEEPNERTPRRIAYADNFRPDRRFPWSH